ncbi:hypothetical protein [Pectobacterium carotovorum]|uniref:hypothetical protein n=1 Tax=Pectobacterium carotovorum TaxID=554 RepID=UPI001887343C|nr:hypothetical protein [Pectobacterium carotovorum]
MNNNPVDSGTAKISFSYNDAHRHEEIIALKIFVFSILRNLPHEVAISTIKTIGKNHDNSILNDLCKEMVDAMIATSLVNKED